MIATEDLIPPGAVHLPWYAICDEFLAPHELRNVIELATGDPQSYSPSGVMHHNGSGVSPDHRRSLIRFDDPQVMSLFEERLHAYADTIFERLHVEPFPVTRLEVQLTRTGDGEFFRTHNDNTHDLLRSRRVTYVFYFHAEPKGFSGGELRLFASRTDGRRWHETEHYVDIEPHQNRLLVFPSFLMHELRPVRVPSGRFEDGRFTVNGWFHAKIGAALT